MEPIDAFDRALDEFDRRVHRVRGDQWDAVTPCDDWAVRDLVNHLTSEHMWAPHLLRGATLDEAGGRFDGDVLEEDPVGAWERAAAESRSAFHGPDAWDGEVHTSGGRIPTIEYGRQMTLDLTVHAWDLARGLGVAEQLDVDLVSAVWEYARTKIDRWQGLGVFAPPVEVPEAADTQSRLVAATGRRP